MHKTTATSRGTEHTMKTMDDIEPLRLFRTRGMDYRRGLTLTGKFVTLDM